MWNAKVAKMGYMWKTGGIHKVRFWEDQWFGSCNLAIKF
jgi:hypothetical protein